MSLTTIIWPVCAGLSLSVAGIYLLVWLSSPKQLESLAFSLAAFSATALSLLELSLMHAQTPAEYGQLLRWMHVPAGVIVVSIVWFVHLYLHTGRLWLAWPISVLRAVILFVNFVSGDNATFQSVDSLKSITFLGETLSLPVGVMHPWRVLIHLSVLLFLIYVLDASFVAFKRGKRRAALVLGSSIACAFFLSAVFSGLMVKGVLPAPLIALVFSLIVWAIFFELSFDLIRVKKISRELRENQERMKLAINAADIGLWEWNIPQDKIWFSRFGRKRLGLDENQTLSFHSYLQTLHPDDQERVKKTIIGALDNSQDLTIQYRGLDNTGEVRWLEIHGKFERDTKGRPHYIRGITFDITERKHAEQKLQRSEYLARLLINTTSLMTHLIDQDGRIIDVNESMANALGKPRQELLGKNVFDYFPPDIARKRRKMFKAAVENHTVTQFQDSFTAGTIYETTIYPCKEPYEGKRQFVVYVHDITNFKELENELRSKKNRLKNAQKIGHIGDWEVNVSTNEHIWSDEMYRILEIDPEQTPVSFETYLACIHPEDRDLVREQFSQGLQSQSPYAGVSRLLFPDGRVKHIYRNATPFLDSNGKIAKMVGVVQDISKLKNAQDESMQLRLELAHINRFMTMNELSVSLAHELNQPLGAILRNAEAGELFLNRPTPDLSELQEILKDICKDVHRASSVIESIRFLLKKHKPRFESLALHEYVDQTLDLLRSEIQKRHAAMQLHISPELPKVLGDRGQLQQVLINLLLNSLDAIEGLPKERRLIVVRARDTGNDMITVEVIDHGQGIPAGIMSHLFEPLVTSKENGLGLGLAISKTIIDHHQGTLKAGNNPDVGARFSFSLRKADGRRTA